MATTIKLKNGSGAPLAGDLVAAEPAFDLTNKRLYTENASGTVIEVGTNPSTIDINAGTIDGTVIGGSSAAAGTFTTFTSTGIDDNATSTAITIDSSENVGIGTASPQRVLVLSKSDSTGVQTQYTNSTTGVGASNGFTVGIDGSENAELWNFQNTDMLFSTNSTERMRINSSGNVGIGDTTPENKLTVVDTDAGSGIAPVKARTSTVNGRASYQIGNDADNWFMGIDGGNSDAFFISDAVGSSDRLVITQGGNVGIGTSSPAGNLHINSASDTYLYVGTSNATADARIQFRNSAGTDAGGLWYATNGNSMRFRTNSAERMRIDSSGNVGIGTTSPGSSTNYNTLTINGTTGGIVEFHSGGSLQSYILGNSSELRMQSQSTQPLTFYTNGTERARIDSSGNVGIGTTSPLGSATERTVHVASSATNTYATMYVTNSNNSVRGYIGVDGNLTQVTLGTQTNHNLLFQTNNTERMRIDSSGNVIIKPSGKFYLESSSGLSPFLSEASNALTVSTNSTERMRIDSSGNLLVGKTTTSLNTAGVALLPNGELYVTRDSGAIAYFNREGSDGDVIVIRNDNVTVGSISVSGSTTSYNPSSDVRLKENIRDYDNALADVMKLKPRKYSWKVDGAEDNGFIAQELMETPEFANRVNPIDDDSDDPMYGVDYMKFVAVLTGAIQEQQVMIEELKAEVAALKGA